MKVFDLLASLKIGNNSLFRELNVSNPKPKDVSNTSYILWFVNDI